jgi:hypothetical protein
VSNLSARALAKLARELDEAVRQARLAYEFCPSSYTYSALSACLAAVEILCGYRRYLNDLASACKSE